MLYPLTFNPAFKERVWGGRNLERLYQKQLPPEIPVGESWEISDRAETTSVIRNGPLAGKSLRWLMEHCQAELFGDAQPTDSRFPLLVKILDADERLSLQVHPPDAIAKRLGGEPKAELWYVAATRPGAEIYAGLKHGVTRDEFTGRIRDGTVADCLHRLSVRPGDAIFLPGGRVHAIGAGVVIFEIQQNSDTTYRIFDWNRKGLDGKPRELQVEQSLQSIDFKDFEPKLVPAGFEKRDGLDVRILVRNSPFSVCECTLPAQAGVQLDCRQMTILGLLSGSVAIVHGALGTTLTPGGFCLLPSSLGKVMLDSKSGAHFLKTTLVDPAA